MIQQLSFRYLVHVLNNTLFTGISKSPSHLTADSDNNNVLLTWESPEDDGGYQIECYCILMRETNTEWEIMAYCNGYKKEYTVECLKPGIPYFFAIAAVNKIGVGTPLEMDTAILLKERNGKLSSFAFYAPGIYGEGYIVLIFPFVGSYVCLFVSSYMYFRLLRW